MKIGVSSLHISRIFILGDSMKIAYFLDIPNGLGGAGNLLIQQAELMAHIYEVIVVIPCDKNGNGNQEYISRCKKKGLIYKILYYETFFNFYSIDYLNAMECSKKIRAFILSEQINFFHSVQLNIAVEMVSRELKIPHLMDIYQLRKEEYTLAYIDIYPHYHLCDSELYAKQWSSMLDITSRCVRPVAPLEKVNCRQHVKKEKYRIAMLGDICARKNQLTAIKAVEKCLTQYDIILEMAGDVSDAYGSLCKRYVNDHDLSNTVEFLGFLSNINDLLERSDCLLCSSLDESFPCSIVEAVTYDLTIISTPVAGVPEIFANQYNAFISKGYEVEDIFNAIIDCLNFYQDGRITELHYNARYTWNQYFSPSAVRNQINMYYIDIINDLKIGKMDSYDLVPVSELKEISKRFDTMFDGSAVFRKRVLYYRYIKNIVRGKVYIWGAGELGKCAYRLIQLLDLEVDVVAFIDKGKTGWYLDKPIKRLDEINFNEADYIFISFEYNRDDAIDYLNTKGIIYNQKSFILP